MVAVLRRWPGTMAVPLTCIALAVLASGCAHNPASWSLDCLFTGTSTVTEDGIVVSEDPGDWCLDAEADSVLLGVFPNPASVDVRIPFGVPRAGPLKVEILGQGCVPVRVLLDTELDGATEGVLWWDLRDEQDHRVPAGIYRCTLEGTGASCYGDIKVLPPPN